MFIDLHTHHLKKGVNILNVHAANFLNNGAPKNTLFSVGEHPWYANEIRTQQLSKNLVAIPQKQLAAIGECGLDRIKGPLLKIQKRVFRTQLELAQQLQIPVIIHQVKSLSDIFSYIKEFKNLSFILHGFSGNQQQVLQLKNYQVYFSLGKAIVNPTNKIKQILREIPKNKFFFETDETNISIEQIYKSFTPYFNGSFEELKKQVEQNFMSVFKHITHELE